ncbi:MAG: type II toxin-antitoxin system RelE/ParE family toxin [Beijerinckiaceae bacterium]
MARIFRHKAAEDDLLEHFVYLAEHAGLETAERFFDRAETSFADLAQRPQLGKPLKLRHPALAGLRKWRIRDFENYLIFYQTGEEGVAIARVLHAASDWWGVLGMGE